MSESERVVVRPGRLRDLRRPRRPGAGARSELAAFALSGAGPDRRQLRTPHRRGVSRMQRQLRASRFADAIDGSFLVIHAAGPFQGADYRRRRALYRDGRSLSRPGGCARLCRGHRPAGCRRHASAGCMVASGVSSTPAITSALIAELAPQFGRIEVDSHRAFSGQPEPAGRSDDRGGAQSTWGERSGTGTTGNGSSGRAGATCAVAISRPPVGRRRVHNCEVPELELFPDAFSGADRPLFRRSRAERRSTICFRSARCLPDGQNRFHAACPVVLERLADAFPAGNDQRCSGDLAQGTRSRRPPDRAPDRSRDRFRRPGHAELGCDHSRTKDASRRAAASSVLFPASGCSSSTSCSSILRPLGIWCARGRRNGWRVRQESGPGRADGWRQRRLLLPYEGDAEDDSIRSSEPNDQRTGREGARHEDTRSPVARRLVGGSDHDSRGVQCACCQAGRAAWLRGGLFFRGSTLGGLGGAAGHRAVDPDGVCRAGGGAGPCDVASGLVRRRYGFWRGLERRANGSAVRGSRGGRTASGRPEYAQAVRASHGEVADRFLEHGRQDPRGRIGAPRPATSWLSPGPTP